MFYSVNFWKEKDFFLKNNHEHFYVHECQIKGLLWNIESLQTYLIQYANQNLFEKQTQFIKMFLEKYPWYLEPNMNNDQLIFTCKKNGNENENMSNVVKYN